MLSVQPIYFFIIVIWASILLIFYELFLSYRNSKKIKQILQNIKFIVNKYNKQNIYLIKKFLKKLKKKWTINKQTYTRLVNNINLYVLYWHYDWEEFKKKDIYYLTKLYQFIIENTIKEFE